MDGLVHQGLNKKGGGTCVLQPRPACVSFIYLFFLRADDVLSAPDIFEKKIIGNTLPILPDFDDQRSL